MRTVEIQADDNGGFKVGLEPEGQEQGEAMGQPQDYLQPVASLDAALQVARDLLSGQTGEQAEEAQESADMRTGYQRGAGVGTPPGPQ